jgi:hypothetical protein
MATKPLLLEAELGSSVDLITNTDIRHKQSDYYEDWYFRLLGWFPFNLHEHRLMTCSNEVQCEAYQKCILVYYYRTTVWGELSNIPARSAGPYIPVGQA